MTGTSGSERSGAVRADDAGSPYPTLRALADGAAGQSGAENFPVALRVLPRGPRELLRRVYAYARFVDDVGDEAEGDRLGLLDVVAADVRRLDTGSGPAELAPVEGMRSVVRERGAPIRLLLDLIEANRVDQRVRSYESFDDLLGYCRLSAAPIGRLVLHIAGAATDANLADSDAVCAALQVLEHCQDVGEDARRGRVYLPAHDLRAAGVADAELRGTTTPDALRKVVAQQVYRADHLLGQGRPLVRRLRGWSRIAVSGFLGGGLATVTALRHADHDVLARAIRPSKITTARSAILLAATR